MPEYKWTLKNKKFCTGCPMFSLVFSHYNYEDDYSCKAGYYTDIVLERVSQKKRPIACVRDLGEW